MRKEAGREPGFHKHPPVPSGGGRPARPSSLRVLGSCTPAAPISCILQTYYKQITFLILMWLLAPCPWILASRRKTIARVECSELLLSIHHLGRLLVPLYLHPAHTGLSGTGPSTPFASHLQCSLTKRVFWYSVPVTVWGLFTPSLQASPLFTQTHPDSRVLLAPLRRTISRILPFVGQNPRPWRPS